MESLERVAGKISPLGFTPLLSSASGGILRYDFRGLGEKVIDKPSTATTAPYSPIILGTPPEDA